MASRRWTRAVLTRALALAGGTVAALLVCEGVARLLESPERVEGRLDPVPDAELGWLPPPGRAVRHTSEFDAAYDVNAQGMNDEPLGGVDGVRTRVLALGDSHTFALGVSRDEAWPKALERALFGSGAQRTGRVYNGAVPGYSVGQYLLRWRTLAPVLRPQVLLVGFSLATDLYDVVPPSHGGFVYYPEMGRVYFDLDGAGRLVEKRDLVGRSPAANDERTAVLRFHLLLQRSALYRRLRSSSVALRIASAWHPGGESFWPGPDTAMKKVLSPEEAYRWNLVGALLEELHKEAAAAGCRVVVVLIPYLPQVYDDVWADSFGRRPDTYDRWIAATRLHDVCRRTAIGFVDTTGRFVADARRLHRRLHYTDDRHPTPEGQLLIAGEAASYLQARDLESPPGSKRY